MGLVAATAAAASKEVVVSGAIAVVELGAADSEKVGVGETN